MRDPVVMEILFMWMNKCEYLGCDTVPIVFVRCYHRRHRAKDTQALSASFLIILSRLHCLQRKIQRNMVFQGYYYIGKRSYYNMWKSKIWKYSLSNDKFRECISLYTCWVMYILCTYAHTQTNTKSVFMPSLTNGNTERQWLVEGGIDRYFSSL